MVLLEEFDDGKLDHLLVCHTQHLARLIAKLSSSLPYLNPNGLIFSDCVGRESKICAEARSDDRRLGGGRAQGHQDGHPVHEDDTATADVLGHGNQGGIQR